MEDDKNENVTSTKRRVYDLPNELVERIVEFQKDKGLPSEVETVRRLLDMALKSRDTLETLLVRYFLALTPGIEPGEAAGIVLSGHPLVKGIDFEEDGIKFRFQKGNSDIQQVEVKGPKDITVTFGNNYGATQKYEFTPSNPPGKRIVDPDVIPF